MIAEHIAKTPKEEIIFLEGRTLTSVDRPETLDDNALKGKKRIAISKQLDTKARIFIPDQIGKNYKQQKSIVSVRAYAATNSSGISKAELETELNKELESSIPMIIEELDKANAVNKQRKDKTLNPATYIETSTSSKSTTISEITTNIHHLNKGETNNEINKSDLEKLVVEGFKVKILFKYYIKNFRKLRHQRKNP